MYEIPYPSERLQDAIDNARRMARNSRDEYITPEHLLWAIAWQPQFMMCSGTAEFTRAVLEYIDNHPCKVPDDLPYEGPVASSSYMEVGQNSYLHMLNSGRDEVDVPHVLNSILHLENSFARNALEYLAEGDTVNFMERIISTYEEFEGVGTYDEDLEALCNDPDNLAKAKADEEKKQEWLKYVSCLNETVATHNPLIGRDRELERTVQVLCRKDKNNPLHVGEAGVGKTALAYGLAARIEEGNVPERLKGSKVYALDLGAMMAGTQFRGDLEKRMKAVLEGVAIPAGDGGNANILYMDEIHTVVGAGRVEGSSLDASNLLKPYLENGSIRFMGATTYDEYNKHVAQSKAFARRFEKINIAEPSLEECKRILAGLKPIYEKYHGVRYTDEAVDYAVTGSDKYITGRYLPDKAIDLIDEAGAWVESHREQFADGETPVIGKKEISEVLSKVCNVEILSEQRDDTERLAELEARIQAKVFGQDEAVRQVTEAVQLASAGLVDDNKPMASLLFVGPTGVGKTEVAKVLASQLGVPLLRFDMSEYVEKHTVAKLIGSPAGYVGYDDGGLLTDAVRKSPHCVLLFDEIEKAHPDIYNILLQVMDYGVLTDNKGQKADFRHVVFIMTTNCGAQYARQSSVGFGNSVSTGESMVRSVKKTFKPEFVNRLTAITVFNDMNRDMARLILDKKLGELRQKLAAKKVTVKLSESATAHLLKEGFSEQYGGREIDRVLTGELKPLLMRAILFGPLREGGVAEVDCKDEKLTLKYE